MTWSCRPVWWALPITAIAGGCALFAGDLPDEAPPLAGLEEPLGLFEEPQDEEQRVALPAGSFSGVYVSDARDTLEEMGSEPEGLLVTEVVENSPGEAAGIEPGDLLIEVTIPAEQEPKILRWPSEWRQIELQTEPGTRLEILYDRAGMEREVELVLVARIRPDGRQAAQRFREEDKVGIVLRTATEVEARRAGLGPGGGAVVVGLSKGSPWRRAGLQFEDLLVQVGDVPVAHPQVVLDAIRETPRAETLRIVFERGHERREIEVAVSRRASQVSSFTIPILFSYEEDRGATDVSLLLGLLGYEANAVAWRWTLLWFISMSGGDADRLIEVDS